MSGATDTFAHTPIAEANRTAKAERLADTIVGGAFPLNRLTDPDVRRDVEKRTGLPRRCSDETWQQAVAIAQQRLTVRCPTCGAKGAGNTADDAQKAYEQHARAAHPKREHPWRCALCPQHRTGYATAGDALRAWRAHYRDEHYQPAEPT